MTVSLLSLLIVSALTGGICFLIGRHGIAKIRAEIVETKEKAEDLAENAYQRAEEEVEDLKQRVAKVMDAIGFDDNV